MDLTINTVDITVLSYMQKNKRIPKRNHKSTVPPLSVHWRSRQCGIKPMIQDFYKYLYIFHEETTQIMVTDINLDLSAWNNAIFLQKTKPTLPLLLLCWWPCELNCFFSKQITPQWSSFSPPVLNRTIATFQILQCLQYLFAFILKPSLNHDLKPPYFCCQNPHELKHKKWTLVGRIFSKA